MASPEAQKDRPAAARAAECKAERLRQRAWNRNHRTTSPRDVAAVEVEQPINPTKNRGPLHSAPPLKDPFKAFASLFVSWRVLGGCTVLWSMKSFCHINNAATAS